MIIPSFGLTATERVLPKLALDFTTASLDSRVTFARTTGASNPATYTNSDGYITTAANNQPRFDYNLVTLACNGLLIEESRVNSANQSSTFNNAIWLKTRLNTTGTPAWVDVVVSPDGTQNADKIIEDTTATSTHFISQSAIGTFTNVTLSVYAKAGERFKVALREDTSTGRYISVNLQTGQILDSSVSDANYTITPLVTAVGNGWYRISLAITTAVSSSRGMQILILPNSYTSGSPTAATYTGNGTSGLYVWGAQLEAGAFATSYIPTTATALTRNADVATMTGTNFSDWYSAGIGGISVNSIPSTISGTRPIIQFDDATANKIIALRGNTSNPELYIVNNGVAQAQIDAGTISANNAYNLTGTWATNSCAAAINGNAAVTDSSATMPTVTQARLGCDGTNYFNGWLQKINYWPQRITNAETQAFSK